MEFRTRENKLNTTTHDFDESHKYVKWEKFVTRDTLSDSIYLKF